MQIKEPILYRQKFFHPEKVILVDGITRTGKSMLGPIMTSFQGVEIERMEMILERICQLYYFNKLKEDAAIALLRLEIHMKTYESMISRNTNFRFTDHSGVWRNVKTLRYLKRLFMKEGDLVLDKIKKEKPIFQVQQHDVLGMSKIYFKAWGDRLRILEMIRNPIDLIEDQYRRGYGKREGHDPRVFSLTIKYKNKVLPRFAVGWEEEYLSLSTMDRVIRLIEARTDMWKKGYNELRKKEQKQVIFIPFEKFIVKPEPYLKRIEKSVGRKRTRLTNNALKKQGVPRILDTSKRKRNKEKILKLASEKYIKKLEKLTKEYEKDVKSL